MPSAEKPWTRTSGTPCPQMATPTRWPSDRVIRWRASRGAPASAASAACIGWSLGPTTGVTAGAVSIRSTRVRGRCSGAVPATAEILPVRRTTTQRVGTGLSRAERGDSIGGQRGARVLAVPGDLVDQRVDRVELDLAPQPAGEADPHVLAVEVAVEVEQVGLEQRRVGLLVEGRAPAQRDRRLVLLPVGPHEPAGVDAVGRQEDVAGDRDVGGREAELPPPVIAVAHQA